MAQGAGAGRVTTHAPFSWCSSFISRLRERESPAVGMERRRCELLTDEEAANEEPAGGGAGALTGGGAGALLGGGAGAAAEGGGHRRSVAAGGAAKPAEERDFFDGANWVKASVYHRTALPAGSELAGPAVIEQEDSTVWVLAGWRATTDQHGMLRLTRD